MTHPPLGFKPEVGVDCLTGLYHNSFQVVGNMGRGHKRGRDNGGFQDQFGEGMISQDRGDRQGLGRGSGGAGGGFRGGGSAGGSTGGRDLQVTRTVPKFLQKHIHLLGRKTEPNPDDDDAHGEAQLKADDVKAPPSTADDSDDEDQREALEKAVMDDPELAKQFPELKDVAARVKANAAKEAGNRAFAAKDFEEAVRQFTEAIQCSPSAVFYSNRAAAHFAMKRYRQSAEDAKQVIILDKSWAKGWSRLGAALSSMEEWSEAKDAYSKALDLEPDDAHLRSMLYKCETEERKQESEGKVKFKASRQKAPAKIPSAGRSAKTQKKQSKLSFDADED